nr:hypothetical protein MFLOJ_00900 [Mycobacterium florentinum]
MPLSAMESGPSVRCVLAGVGISDRRSVPAAEAVGVCDTVVVTVFALVVLVPDAVLGPGELLQPATTTPTVTAATTHV